MRFGDLHILQYAIIMIIAFAVFYIWATGRYKRASIRFAEKEMLEKINPYYDEKLLRVKALLNIAAILLIGLSLARPQWGTYWKEKRSVGIDIIIALDVSKSMLAQDVSPDRLNSAKQEIRSFVNNLEGDRIGLMAFAGDAFLYCPLTMDYSGFLLAMNSVKVSSVARGGTSMPGLIAQAVRDFKWAVSGDKQLIIISDGENTDGDIEEAAAGAKAEHIQISCAGAGTREGALLQYYDEKGNKEFVNNEAGKPVRSCLDEKNLKYLASETGGIYAALQGARPGLGIIYKERLSKLRKQAREEMLAKSYKERFQIPLALALLALLADITLTIAGKRNENI